MATPRRRRSEPRRAGSAVAFWAKTLLIAAVCASGSYYLGKHVVGDALRTDESSRPHPKFLARPAPEPSAAPSEEAPPAQPEVKVEPREPTEREQAEAKHAATEEASQPAGGASEGQIPEAASQPPSPDNKPPTAAESRRTEASGNKRYVVRAGSFTQADKARELMEELARSGLHPYLTTTIVGGKQYHRVNVTSVSSREAAEKVRSQLEAEGHQATIAEEEAQ